jgi:heme exporter protein A|tara:strand:- start:1351 stop:2103 length:753 start_codon:yes stop_codon:yes gene_type:complete
VSVPAHPEADEKASTNPVLQAQGLVREYGSVIAVNGIDLSLGRGEFLTIFGPNGAGKTSLLALLAGALRPSRGQVWLRGEALDFGEVEWRRRIGVLSHQSFLYGHLSAEENLRFYGQLFGLSDVDNVVRDKLQHLGLQERAASLVRDLSHGMRQRLALARALLHDPDIVLLDEPYTGLDPSAALVLQGVLSDLRDGRRTVVMVTHNLSEGVALATTVAIMNRGRFVWQGKRAELGDDFGQFYHSVIEGHG